MKPILTPEQQARIDKLLAWLDAGGDDETRFDMSDFLYVHTPNMAVEYPNDSFYSCGTYACMAGKLLIDEYGCKNNNDIHRTAGHYSVSAVAGELIGMNSVDALMMFTEWKPSTSTDTAHAAERIRHWLETSEVIS